MSLKIELLSLLSNDLLTIIRNYVGWSLTGKRKQKNVCNFWPKKWSRSLKKFELWSLTRELLKQYLTEEQNGCLRSGRLREVDEVVAMRELTVLQAIMGLISFNLLDRSSFADTVTCLFLLHFSK